MMIRNTQYTIWCDGSCLGNPGPGGWAAIIESPGGRREIWGSDKTETTNNKMELTALIESLKLIPENKSVTVVTDSQYLIKGCTVWLKNWLKTNWNGGNVKNQDLWKTLSLLIKNRNCNFQWVKGHSGHSENSRCDELAKAAIYETESEEVLFAGENIQEGDIVYIGDDNLVYKVRRATG